MEKRHIDAMKKYAEKMQNSDVRMSSGNFFAVIASNFIDYAISQGKSAKITAAISSMSAVLETLKAEGFSEYELCSDGKRKKVYFLLSKQQRNGQVKSKFADGIVTNLFFGWGLPQLMVNRVEEDDRVCYYLFEGLQRASSMILNLFGIHEDSEDAECFKAYLKDVFNTNAPKNMVKVNFDDVEYVDVDDLEINNDDLNEARELMNHKSFAELRNEDDDLYFIMLNSEICFKVYHNLSEAQAGCIFRDINKSTSLSDMEEIHSKMDSAIWEETTKFADKTTMGISLTSKHRFGGEKMVSMCFAAYALHNKSAETCEPSATAKVTDLIEWAMVDLPSKHPQEWCRLWEEHVKHFNENIGLNGIIPWDVFKAWNDNPKSQKVSAFDVLSLYMAILKGRRTNASASVVRRYLDFIKKVKKNTVSDEDVISFAKNRSNGTNNTSKAKDCKNILLRRVIRSSKDKHNKKGGA